MPSKLCPHSLNPVPELRQFVEAGCPLIKLVDDFGPAVEFKDRFPNLVIIGRITEDARHDRVNAFQQGLSFEAAAQAFVDRQREKYRLNPAIQIWEGPNETALSHGAASDPEVIRRMAWFAGFESRRLVLLADMRLRGVVGNFSTGTPDLRLWQHFVPALQSAVDHNGFLGLHEYMGAKPDFGVGDNPLRYRNVPEIKSSGVRLVITEFGFDRVQGPEGFETGAWRDLSDQWIAHGLTTDPERFCADAYIWYGEEIRKDPFVIGACIFTFGNAGNKIWKKHDLSESRVPGFLVDYMASVRGEADPSSTVRAAAPCVDNAKFIDDVTIEDGTVLQAGRRFPVPKTWRVLNNGTCEWNEKYALRFVNGEKMGSPDAVPLKSKVPPGSTHDISVELTAPVSPGPATGRWRLHDDRGVAFGTNLTVVIKVVRGEVGPGRVALVGLHGRADGPLNQGDLNAIRESKVEAVKLDSKARPEDVDAIRAIKDKMFLVVRLFVAFTDSQGQRTIPPEQFVRDTKDDLRKFFVKGVFDFEIHNEPNLFEEGYGKNWTGATFADWWIRVRDGLRGEFPGAKFGWPGVSPGPVVEGKRGEAERDFVTASRRAVLEADWIGVHCYWVNQDEMISPDAGNGWQWYAEQFPGKPLMITEFSNPNRDLNAVPKHEKAQQYVDWLAQLDGPVAAFGYVSSASDPKFEHETWVEKDQQLSVIPGVVGRRQP